jgi:hypothetical protein
MNNLKIVKLEESSQYGINLIIEDSNTKALYRANIFNYSRDGKLYTAKWEVHEPMCDFHKYADTSLQLPNQAEIDEIILNINKTKK